MEEKYADTNRESHIELLNYIGETRLEEGDEIAICRYGKRTQHIFKNGNYMLTIDWSKV